MHPVAGRLGDRAPEPSGESYLLVFRLGGEREHALPVSAVLEVLRMVLISPLPEAPPWLAGVINLRGRTVPVVDLRMRLGIPASTVGLSTPIVIARGDGGPVGLIVDRVEEVARLGDGGLEAPTELAGATHAVQGIARVDGRLVVVLDLRRVLEEVDVSSISDRR